MTTETPAIVSNNQPEAHSGSSVLSKVFSAALKSQDKSRSVSLLLYYCHRSLITLSAGVM